MAARNMALAGTAAAALFNVAAALNPIKVEGQNFVDSVTGSRFEIVGVDYQPGGSSGYDPTTGKDPLSDGDACLRDAALLQRLGANTIRSYNLDPNVNHDACASIFNAAGIYMVIDVNSPLPNESINNLDPSSSYNADYLKRTFAILDNFGGYANTLAFFGANELVNDNSTSKFDPPYIRAVQRDLKQYQAARKGRQIPIGYSAADVREILPDTTNYISCSIQGEEDNISRSDFIGVNGYSWCGGDATFVSSNYNQLAEFYADTTIPVFFSEYGCIKPAPRFFHETASIYGTDMPTFSGGLVYEWTMEENGYGLVQINDNNTLSLLNDYNTLRSQFSKIDPSILSTRNDTATSLTPPMCSDSLISSDMFSNDFDLPSQPDGVAALIKNGVGGIKGQLSDPSSLNVKMTVYDSNGAQLQNLAVKKVSSANSPSGTTGDGSSPSEAAAPANLPAGHLVAGGLLGSLLWLLA